MGTVDTLQMYIHFRVLSCSEVKKFLFKYPQNFSIWKKLVAIFPKESRSKWMSIWLNISYMRRNTLYKKNKKSYINFISYVTINFRTTPWPWKGWMFILFLKLLETSSWHSGLLRNLLLEWWDGVLAWVHIQIPLSLDFTIERWGLRLGKQQHTLWYFFKPWPQTL